jgi:hypothetical protein
MCHASWAWWGWSETVDFGFRIGDFGFQDEIQHTTSDVRNSVGAWRQGLSAERRGECGMRTLTLSLSPLLGGEAR